MTVLLDSNVLVGLLSSDHVHHDRVQDWFARHGGPYATCPITEGSFVRLFMRCGGGAQSAVSRLEAFTVLPSHVFWSDSLSYSQVRLDGVIGHRQVTDAYLASLARSRKGRVATFDAGFAALHPDVAELLPA